MSDVASIGRPRCYFAAVREKFLSVRPVILARQGGLSPHSVREIKLTFVELPLFTSLVTQIADDHFLNQLQNDLLKDPEKGDLIPRLHGLRKVRMALQGKSRAGGARAIYLYLPQHHTVIFFYVYSKAKSENLSPDQEHRLRVAVEKIKREFRHEKIQSNRV
jgi:hypothetical protein